MKNTSWSLIPSYCIHGDNYYLTTGIKEDLRKFNIKFVGLSANEQELKKVVEQHNPHLVILADYSSFSLAKTIKKISPESRIFANGKPSGLNESLCINDFFSAKKPESLSTLVVEYLENLQEGDFTIKKDFGAILALKESSFSDTEISILFKICCGFTREQIASERQVKPAAITYHLKSIRQKLHFDTNEEVVVFAFRSGFVTAKEEELDKLKRLRLSD